MQKNFLKEIVESIAGKNSVNLVDLLAEKKDVNEFLIAKKLKLTINQTRNVLYKLSESGLVTSTRKKDKRKGWFIYFWTLDTVKSLELLEKKMIEEIEKTRAQLQSRKSKRFYFCKICNVEVSEETALLNQFTCQECGQVYELSETVNITNELESKIARLSKQLASIQEEKVFFQEKGKKAKKSKKKPKTKAKPSKTKEKAKKSAKQLKNKTSKKKK